MSNDTSHRALSWRRSWSWKGTWALSALLAAAVSFGAAGTDQSLGDLNCEVPSTQYPTIQSAFDQNCDLALLSAGDYAEFLTIDDDFAVTGPTNFSARILGQVTIDTDQPVNFQYVTIVTGPDPTPLFQDGFESGDTSAWS